ncbi:hypothetical protein [Pseudomonas helleri]|uniref:hypothetical protein n=1 Tax=Pseudomonas helleri TaxID=1608996 RepID=UPI00382F5BDF
MKHGRVTLAHRIPQIKSRLDLGIVEGELAESSTRMRELRKALNKLEKVSDSELYRYFPVASIATLESHFRQVVTLIVNVGGDYLSRGVELLGDKVKAIEIIPMMHSNHITAGEIVAYSLPFSSLAHVESVLDKLLGESFKYLAASVEDPWPQRLELEWRGPIVEDVLLVWRNASQAFEDRHIIAHESASKFFVSYKRAENSVESIAKLIEVMDAVLWATVWKSVPLTQREINDAAYKRMQQSRLMLAQSLRRRRHSFEEFNRRSEFRKLHLHWKLQVNSWVKFNVAGCWMGAFKDLVWAEGVESAIESRILEIDRLMG